MKSNALASLAAAAAYLVAASAAHAGHARHHNHHARAPASVTWVTTWVTVSETYCPTECPNSNAVPSSNIPFYERPAVNSSAPPPSSASQKPTPALPSPIDPPIKYASPTSPPREPDTSTSQPAQPATPVPAPQNPPPIEKIAPSAPPPAPPSTELLPPKQEPPSNAGSGGGGGGDGSTSAAGTLIQGQLTYYQVGLGSCGWDDSNKDKTGAIVALSHKLMGEQSNGNSMCGRTITIYSGNEEQQATVRDKCMGCERDDIDVNSGLFEKLRGGLTEGRVNVKWKFNN